MRKPDTPCTDCGRLLYRGTGSLAQPTCRACRKSRAARERTCETCGKPRAYTADRYCSLACATQARTTRTVAACAICGQSFIRKRDRISYCSRACAVVGRSKPQVWKWRCLLEWRGCLECGATFCTDARSNRTFCSVGCRRRLRSREWYYAHPESRAVGAHRRRARLVDQYVEDVDPIRVYERDKWRCHICGGRVRRSPRRKHDPDMASLDHLLPIALGGEHSYANVACAHYRCNLSKGTRAVGEQLALIG